MFDGAPLDAKEETIKQRKEKRELAKKRGEEFIKKNDNARAYAEFRSALEITAGILKEMMDLCTEINIPFIRAPYESDHQLLLLFNENLVDAVYTEDSDLIANGCPFTITKLQLTVDNALCQTIKFDDIYDYFEKEFGNKPTNQKTIIPFDTRFKDKFADKFLVSCIVAAGCDYTDGYPNVGFKTAFKFLFSTQKHTCFFDALKTLPTILSKLTIHPRIVPFIEEWKKAVHVFKSTVIFDTVTLSQRNLTPASGDYGTIAGKICGNHKESILYSIVTKENAIQLNNILGIGIDTKIFDHALNQTLKRKASYDENSNTNPKNKKIFNEISNENKPFNEYDSIYGKILIKDYRLKKTLVERIEDVCGVLPYERIESREYHDYTVDHNNFSGTLGSVH